MYHTAEGKLVTYGDDCWTDKLNPRSGIPVGDGDDEKHLIIVVNGDSPEGWDQVNTDGMTQLDEARERLNLTDAASGRRGSFPSIGTGVSFGGGQLKPMNFSYRGIKEDVVNSLNQSTAFRQIADFQSCEH
jgi:hypothetical protein